MGGKKQPAKKSNLNLDETQSEPSAAEKIKSKKSVQKKDDFVPPSNWGAQGEGGYFAF